MEDLDSIFASYTPSKNESQTETGLIQPVLQALGHDFEVQASLQTPEGTKKPDYVFYKDAASLDANKGQTLDEEIARRQSLRGRGCEVLGPSAGRGAKRRQERLADQQPFLPDLLLHAPRGHGLGHPDQRAPLAALPPRHGPQAGPLLRGGPARACRKRRRGEVPVLLRLFPPGGVRRRASGGRFGSCRPATTTPGASGTRSRSRSTRRCGTWRRAFWIIRRTGWTTEPETLQRHLRQFPDHASTGSCSSSTPRPANCCRCAASEMYRDTYSLHADKTRHRRRPTVPAPDERHPLERASKQLFQIIDQGSPPLSVATFNGGLFDPARHPFLEQLHRRRRAPASRGGSCSRG